MNQREGLAVDLSHSADDSELPEGWAWTTIGEAFELNPPKAAKGALADDAPVTFVPMPALDAESGSITAGEERAFAEVRKGYTSFRDGDVIVAKITPCMENGKAAIATGLTNGLGFGSTEFHVLRPTGAADANYVYHFVRQESFRQAAASEMTGSVGQKRVPASFLNNAPFPLPPLAEQGRIVAAVEALLARVGATRARLERAAALLRRIRQAVLAHATTGHLTADWREQTTFETSPEALRNYTLHRRRAQWDATNARGKYKPPAVPSLESANDDGALPVTWAWASPDEVCQSIVDCPHSTPKWSDSGEVCLRTTNFRSGFLDLSEVRYVSTQTFAERNARLVPMPSDVVYSREGGILGIACQIPDGARVCLGQRMMLMRADPEVYAPKFLMHVLNSPMTNARVREMTGGTSSPHLNVGDVKAFPIPLPPLSEQREIVRRVEALFALADAAERRIAAARSRADPLTQAILAKAFRGELVPTEAELARQQNRPYEPAAALLARIRANASNGSAPPQRKRRRS